MGETVLKLDEICISYGAAVAVSKVSMNVEQGEVVALLGANGAGKSSLLRAISGLVPVQSGAIDYGGKDLLKVPSYQRARNGIAHVPEGRHIFSSFSVQENLAMGAYCRDSGSIPEQSRLVYDRFPRLLERRNQAGGSLSGGEQQMLAIGRALMSQPRLLLLDEPSLGLSPIAIDTVFDAIRKVREEGVSMLLVEQNSEMALSVADRVYILRTGRLVLEGTSDEIRGNPDLLNAYLGSPGGEDN